MAKSGPLRKKRPGSRGAVPNEKALLAALVVALGAGLLGTGYGTRYVELARDYARCSSAERSYIASTSLEDANHVLFMVDDLEDRHLRDGFNRVPPSRDARCIAVPTEGPHLRSTCGKTGRCTLRAALEHAATIDRDTPVTVQLRGGFFRLAAPLPEVVGAVHMVGVMPGSASRALVGGGGPPPLSRIGVSPDELETVIDGGGSVQLLRTDPYSRLHLQDLRLENGVALFQNERADPRLALGGAINALGGLILTNTVVRNNRAINGGGLYTEGDVDVHNSRLEHNLAHQCGGALYAAAGGKVHVAHSGIHSNHDRCERRTSAIDIPNSDGVGSTNDPPELAERQAAAARAKELATPPKDSFKRHVSSGALVGMPAGRRPQKQQTDVSGAIAEGPRLSGNKVPSGAARRAPEPDKQRLETAHPPRRARDERGRGTGTGRGGGLDADRGGPRASGGSGSAEGPAGAGDPSGDGSRDGGDTWQFDELRALREARQAREQGHG